MEARWERSPKGRKRDSARWTSSAVPNLDGGLLTQESENVHRCELIEFRAEREFAGDEDVSQ